MPNFISKGGIWEPAKERAVIGKPGEEEIYEGPDREAVKEIEVAGGMIGMDFHNDPEMIMRARQMNYKNVDDYLSAFNYDKIKAMEAYEKAKAQVITHSKPQPKVPIVVQSGGDDVSGSGKSRKGGWEIPADAPVAPKPM